MIKIEDVCDPEWAEWYMMTPNERWEETEKLRSVYLMLGGSLETRTRHAKSFLRCEGRRRRTTDE